MRQQHITAETSRMPNTSCPDCHNLFLSHSKENPLHCFCIKVKSFWVSHQILKRFSDRTEPTCGRTEVRREQKTEVGKHREHESTVHLTSFIRQNLILPFSENEKNIWAIWNCSIHFWTTEYNLKTWVLAGFSKTFYLL